MMTHVLFIALILTFAPFMSAQSGRKSMCGPDERELSHQISVMRLRPRLDSDKRSCSGFMISDTCGITAGHCADNLKYAEFNVPHGPGLTQVRARDLFEVDLSSIQSRNGGKGNDYAVFRLRPHKDDQRLAGEVYGHFEVAQQPLNEQDQLEVIGYGASYGRDDTYLSQKHSFGEVKDIFTRMSLPLIPDKAYIEYNAGTSGGDSGGVVLNVSSREVVGVHTNGVCYFGGRLNSATYIQAHKKFQNAIQNCLENERD